MRSPAVAIAFTLNGRATEVDVDPVRRLADVLREDLGLTGTKVGCNAGDCGACTVLLDGRQICSCMVPAAQVAGRSVTTVEGLAVGGQLSRLQAAFHARGAAQCGICTPGMLIAAADLLARKPKPTAGEVADGLGGVLCRCTGYAKIIEAVLAAASGEESLAVQPPAGAAVGARMAKTDGLAKVTGAEKFGADDWPEGCLVLRAVRSPHHHARFTLGDLRPLHDRHPGLVKVLTAADILGNKRFGIYPTGKDQPVLAEGHVRQRGEPVLALVGEPAAIEAIRDHELPIAWEALPALSLDAALAPGAPALHADFPDNVLTRGRVVRGDVDAGFAGAAIEASGSVETAFVEHAYIELEAGYARRLGERIEIVACTQTPYMDRDELALILGCPRERVRVIPTAVGGGFGGKLDLSLQPLIATAAWILDRPVGCAYTRPESFAATTKRHPARLTARLGADRDGRLVAFDFQGDFNTGAYASWGPTVASRVPVHAMGPYEVANVRCLTRAVYTNDTPAGAFRGFGVPQAAILGEALTDEVAERLGLDPLEFRHRNALRKGSTTATGQVLEASAGLQACLDALRPHWRQARSEAERHNRGSGTIKRGAGVACMWYGIGNTSLTNPSTMRVGLGPDGTLTLYNGAVDIGQGSNTVMVQIAADALGLPAEAFRVVAGDTDLTEDAGKTSASRQTFVSGNAAKAAGEDLRRQILRLANVGDGATLSLEGPLLRLRDGAAQRTLDLSALLATEAGDVLVGRGCFDPPTTPLDADGQGVPYATYAFAAQMAEIAVDIELGTIKVTRIVAAHDVGRAINPTQVEGQIQGGIAQGLGLALMEEFLPGRNENLHDYLIPTIGDVPPIECILIEHAEPLGPHGAKGIGEPALIATAPAILNALHHATGVRLPRVPATPDRVRAALVAKLRSAADD